MTARKKRSVFWVVSTHVLTTGIAIPFLVGLLGVAFVMATQPPELTTLLVLLLTRGLGYVGGVYYSLSYIRKSAIIAEPTRCTTPSVVTFSVLLALGFALDVWNVFRDLANAINPYLGVVVFGVFYLFVGAAFTLITKAGFARMEQEANGEP